MLFKRVDLPVVVIRSRPHLNLTTLTSTVLSANSVAVALDETKIRVRKQKEGAVRQAKLNVADDLLAFLGDRLLGG